MSESGFETSARSDFVASPPTAADKTTSSPQTPPKRICVACILPSDSSPAPVKPLGKLKQRTRHQVIYWKKNCIFTRIGVNYGVVMFVLASTLTPELELKPPEFELELELILRRLARVHLDHAYRWNSGLRGEVWINHFLARVALTVQIRFTK